MGRFFCVLLLVTILFGVAACAVPLKRVIETNSSAIAKTSITEERVTSILKSYIPSSNNAYYTRARADCEGLNQALAEFGEEKEFSMFKKDMQSRDEDYVGEYWVGGIFDQQQNDYVWSSTGQRITTNWFAKDEEIKKGKLLKVYADLSDKYNIVLRVIQENTSLRYVCEISQPLPCKTSNN